MGDLPSPSTSVMRRDRMCCSSWTTSSASPSPVPRCLPFWDVFLPLWDTSPPSPLTWVGFRSVLPPRPRDPLLPSRPCTCLLMILPIPPRPPPLLTWTPPPSSPVPLPSLVSTPLSIPSTPPPVCLIPESSGTSTTRWHDPPRSSSRITRACRISLPFLVWMSCRRTTSSL